jgi:hypothetical protein
MGWHPVTKIHALTLNSRTPFLEENVLFGAPNLWRPWEAIHINVIVVSCAHPGIRTTAIRSRGWKPR